MTASNTPNASSATVVRLAGIGMTYAADDGSKVPALAGIDLTIREGEFLSLLGPSGCGKSTLMMIAAGLLAPTTGTVEVARGGDKAPKIGVVFQEALLFPWRNVIENVMLPGELSAKPTGADRDAAEKLLKLVGLDGVGDKYPHELSGGMQQRVAIARALMAKPALLLMDEPFGALDAITREQMNVELQRLHGATGVSVVFVTHSIPESVFLSDRVVVLAGKPSTIAKTVTIDLPRARAIEDLATTKAQDYVAELRRALHGPAEGKRDASQHFA